MLFNAPLTVTATYESWDFRWAYVVRYAESFKYVVAEESWAYTTLNEDQRAALRFLLQWSSPAGTGPPCSERPCQHRWMTMSAEDDERVRVQEAGAAASVTRSMWAGKSSR